MTPYDRLCTGRQQHCKLPAVSAGKRALLQVERGVPKPDTETEKGRPKRSKAQHSISALLAMVLLSGQSKTLPMNTQSVCRLLSVSSTCLGCRLFSCCTVRLTLVCATGKQPAEILIETFRLHAAESFLST